MNICSASRLFSTPSLDFMLLLLLFYSAVHKGFRVNSRVSCTIEWIVWLRMVYALCSSYIYGVNFVWYLCWFPLEIFISNILTIKLKWMKKRCCWDGNHTQTANARGCIKWNWNKSGSHWKWKFSNEMDILHFIFRRNTQINKNPPKSKCLFNCGAVESKKKKSFTFYLLQLSRTRCSTHATSMPYYLWLIFLLFNCIYSSQLSRVFGQRVNKRHTRVKLRSVFFLLSSPSRIYALCLFNREPLITFYAFNKKQKHWICISHGCNLCLRMPQPSTLDAFFFFLLCFVLQ